jgi:hypothetical protein
MLNGAVDVSTRDRQNSNGTVSTSEIEVPTNVDES